MRCLGCALLAMVLLTACGGSDSARSSSADSSSTAKRASGKNQANVQSDIKMGDQVKVIKRKTYSKEDLRERQKPSTVPGLTQGQVADMPEVAILPSIFGLLSKESQIEAHAMITAREEVEGGYADLVTVEQRYVYVRHVWLADWAARKDLLQGVVNEHAAYAERLRNASARNAAWRRADNDRKEQHDREMERIYREELPVLTPEEERLLKSL